MGAKSTTLAGLSGTGDIMLTCFVNLSRNRTVGVRLGAGESLSDILSSMNQVSCRYSYSTLDEEKSLSHIISFGKMPKYTCYGYFPEYVKGFKIYNMPL